MQALIACNGKFKWKEMKFMHFYLRTSDHDPGKSVIDFNARTLHNFRQLVFETNEKRESWQCGKVTERNSELNT